MPNWCDNIVTFAHSGNTQLLERITDAVEKSNLLNELYPLPEALKETRSPVLPKNDNDIVVNLSLRASLGADNWYDWCTHNWGTKWDISDGTMLDSSPNEVEAEFQTAWTPPVSFYEHVEETTGVKVTAYYSELGCDFLGRYKDGVDLSFQASGYLRHLDATGEDPIDITSVMNFDSYFLDKDEWEKEELLEQDMWLESEIAFGEDNEEES